MDNKKLTTYLSGLAAAASAAPVSAGILHVIGPGNSLTAVDNDLINENVNQLERINVNLNPDSPSLFGNASLCDPMGVGSKCNPGNKQVSLQTGDTYEKDGGEFQQGPPKVKQNKARATAGSFVKLAKVNFGDTVDGTLNWKTSGDLFNSGYLGLQVFTPGGSRFGWLRYTLGSIEFDEVAIQDDGSPITVGQTAEVNLPVPPSLLLLAGGLAGFGAYRRRLQQSAA